MPATGQKQKRNDTTNQKGYKYLHADTATQAHKKQNHYTYTAKLTQIRTERAEHYSSGALWV